MQLSDLNFFLVNIENSGNAEARYNDIKEMTSCVNKELRASLNTELKFEFTRKLFRYTYSEFKKCLNNYCGIGYEVITKEHISLKIKIPKYQRFFRVQTETLIPDELYSFSLCLSDPKIKKLSPDYNCALLEVFDDETLKVNFEIQLIKNSYISINQDLEEIQKSIKILIHKLLNLNARFPYPIYKNFE